MAELKAYEIFEMNLSNLRNISEITSIGIFRQNNCLLLQTTWSEIYYINAYKIFHIIIQQSPYGIFLQNYYFKYL